MNPLSSVSCVRTRLVLLCIAAIAACTGRDRPEAEAAAEREPASESKPSSAAPARPRDPAERESTVDGYRVIHARTKNGESTAIQVKPPKGWDVIQLPSEPDPHGGKFTLEEATQGLGKRGTLAARIATSMGSFYCDLFADKAPNTVANFVGLARGLRKFWDPQQRAWIAAPHYDGTTFHRVIPNFMIQGGDREGTGRGRLGYQIPDEVDPALRHDRAGQLCMANRGPNTNEGQFFITERAAPHLDGSYTIFGQCEPAALVQRIARVPQSGPPGNRPLTPVTIERVEIKRLAGGAAKWMPESAQLPPLPGVVPPGRAVQDPAPAAPAAP